jgi:hypothetical protein
MKKIIKVSILLFICSMSFSSMAQKSKLYLELNKTYSNGKIYIKKNYTPILATKITFVNDSVLNFTDSNTGKVKSLNVYSSSINYLKLRTGTKAGEFAFYGGAFMGLCALYGVLSAEQTSLNENGETSRINWFPLVGGFTAGGAVVGALIGLCSSKYKNFYIRDNTTSFNFGVTPYYCRGGGGIVMKVAF